MKVTDLVKGQGMKVGEVGRLGGKRGGVGEAKVAKDPDEPGSIEERRPGSSGPEPQGRRRAKEPERGAAPRAMLGWMPANREHLHGVLRNRQDVSKPEEPEGTQHTRST